MTTASSHNYTPDTYACLVASGHYIDSEVAKGRSLVEVLSEDPLWHDRDRVRDFSAAVAASFRDYDHATYWSLVITGRHVDSEVSKGRSLDDVLFVERQKATDAVWFEKANLRQFSAAVAASYLN